MKKTLTILSLLYSLPAFSQFDRIIENPVTEIREFCSVYPVNNIKRLISYKKINLEAYVSNIYKFIYSLTIFNRYFNCSTIAMNYTI